MEPGNRRLIRPSLTPTTHVGSSAPPLSEPHRDGHAADGLRDVVHKDSRPPRKEAPNNKKAPPPDQTNAENFYYIKQMQSKTPMTIVLKDGESLTGVIEWYDKHCLKVNREGAPNLLVYKSYVKYMHKA